MTVAYLAPQGTFTHQAARERFGESAAVSRLADDRRRLRGRRARPRAVRRGARWRTPPTAPSTSRSIAWSRPSCRSAASWRWTSPSTCCRGRGTSARSSACCRIPRGSASAATGWPRTCRDVPVEETTSTAGAAELAATDALGRRHRLRAGRAASTACPCCAPRIEDNRQNSTRFLVIGRQPAGPSGGRDKTSILFAMRNEPGALHKILEPLARLGINLTKIESRPAQARADVGIRDVRRSRGPPRDAARWPHALSGDGAAHPVPQGARVVPGGLRRAHAHAVGVAGQRTHPGDRALRARQAHRGARARARDPRRHQARVEREPAGALRRVQKAIDRGAAPAQPLSGRQRLLSAPGAGQEARGVDRPGRARQRLQRADRADRAHAS